MNKKMGIGVFIPPELLVDDLAELHSLSMCYIITISDHIYHMIAYKNFKHPGHKTCEKDFPVDRRKPLKIMYGYLHICRH